STKVPLMQANQPPLPWDRIRRAVSTKSAPGSSRLGNVGDRLGILRGSKTVAVGMAVSDHPPHRPVLAALPHTVLTLDVTPFRVWRRSEHREMHEQFSVRVASNRRSAPVSPRWAAFGCAVPAHETSSGRPVA